MVVEAPLSAARAQHAGKSGLAGMLKNSRTCGIAIFASLGGLVYGYNQGMFAQVLTMNSFVQRTQGYAETTGIGQGLLTSILELGAWLGTLMTGYGADRLGRKGCCALAVVVFTVGVIVQACTQNKNYVLAGRFITGLGVGSLSMVVPLYNAELSPPEIRGSLVALQQLAITFGIMISFWIGYGTNFIGGTGASQSDAAWLIPVCLQLIPSTVLGIGMVVFMPQSPRHLMNVGREEESLQVLAKLRRAPEDDLLVRTEFLEIKALRMFEQEVSRRRYPQYQDGSFKSDFMIGFNDYKSLLTNRSLFKRTTTACLVMFFQQWNGINAINYYAPFIFDDFGFSGSTTSLLATGVVGCMEFLFTIPAVLYVDQFGRKKILIVGAIGMAVCHFIVAGLIGGYEDRWSQGLNRGAGWAAIVFIWIYICNFAFSWGPVAWIIVSEVFPLSLRAKGVSLGGSSNWLNNFAVALSTSPFIGASSFGAFIFFGAITTVGAIWVFFFVPETKGLTLEEMDEVFGVTAFAVEDAKLKEQIDREIGLLAILGLDDAGSTEKKVDEPVLGAHKEVAE